jgi:hypothetical protein
MTKDTDSLVPEVKLLLRTDEDPPESVVVGTVYFDQDEREVRVRLRGGEFSPRELHSLADQAFMACERLLEGK